MALIYKTSGEAAEYAYYGLNHYAGCGHGCAYCYMHKMAKRFHFDFAHPRPRIDPDELVELLDNECGNICIAGMKKRVQLCFSTDPYQPIDAEFKLTRRVIEVLRKHNVPFQILTKGGAEVVRDFHLYGPDDLFGATLTTMDDSSLMEPFAASSAQRIAALKAAKRHGIATWVSCEPVLFGPDTLRIIQATHTFVNLFKIGKLNGQKSGANWRDFAEKAVALCERLGAKYYLKQNLANLLPAGSYHNTDWRETRDQSP